MLIQPHRPRLVVVYVRFSKSRVYEPLGNLPQAAYIPLIEYAGIHGAVPCLDLLGKAQVIIHREMEIEQVLLTCCVDPADLEPVVRALGVTVEPEL